jgi:ABC-type multidrug transport system permease subunit
MFTAVLFSILSGYTWPSYGMPDGLRYISNSIAAFHMISIIRKVALMGARPALLIRHFLALLAWLSVAAPWGYWAVRKQMKLESAPPE